MIARSDFIEARRTGIGGSDIGAILGVSPFKSAMDVYLAKTEPNPSDEQTELTYWGHALEPVIIKRFEEEHGLPVERPDIVRHPEHEWMVANLDGIITGEKPGVLEIKNVNQFAAKAWGEEGSDEVPLAYVAQCAWYMAVMDFDYAIVAALFGGNDYREYRIDRDPDLEKSLIRIGSEFWHAFVVPRNPPAPANEKDALRLLNRTHDDGSVRDADDEAYKLYCELKNAKADEAVIKGKISDLEARLKIYTGNARALVYRDKRLATYTTQSSKRLDQKAFKAAMPDVFDQFCKSSETRVFRLK